MSKLQGEAATPKMHSSSENLAEEFFWETVKAIQICSGSLAFVCSSDGVFDLSVQLPEPAEQVKQAGKLNRSRQPKLSCDRSVKLPISA